MSTFKKMQMEYDPGVVVRDSDSSLREAKVRILGTQILSLPSSNPWATVSRLVFTTLRGAIGCLWVLHAHLPLGKG